MALGLGQLRAFHAVVAAGGVTRAAQRLAVTPPAISAQIRELERQAGLVLFERAGRSTRLTSAGETLADYTRRIFTLLDDAEHALSPPRAGARGRIRVAASDTAAAYYLGPFWRALRRDHPQLRIDVSVHNSGAVAAQVVSRAADLGVLAEAAAPPELVLVPLVEDVLVVVVAPDHPLAARRAIDLRDVAAHPMIVRERGSATRDLVEREMARRGVAPRIAMEIDSNEAIKRAIEAGLGVGVLSGAVVHREVRDGALRVIPFRGRAPQRVIHLAYHVERRDSPLLRAVLQTAATIPPPRRADLARHHLSRGNRRGREVPSRRQRL
jgi:LysR family transcriptional regulator, low CO2-responsive transcriptional regulator